MLFLLVTLSVLATEFTMKFGKAETYATFITWCFILCSVLILIRIHVAQELSWKEFIAHHAIVYFIYKLIRAPLLTGSVIGIDIYTYILIRGVHKLLFRSKKCDVFCFAYTLFFVLSIILATFLIANINPANLELKVPQEYNEYEYD